MQFEGQRLLCSGKIRREYGRLLQLSETSLPRLSVMGTMACGEPIIRMVLAVMEADARIDLLRLGSWLSWSFQC